MTELIASFVMRWRGKMSDYIQVLINICFTMVTGVVIVGCLGAILFFCLMIWQMIDDHLY